MDLMRHCTGVRTGLVGGAVGCPQFVAVAIKEKTRVKQRPDPFSCPFRALRAGLVGGAAGCPYFVAAREGKKLIIQDLAPCPRTRPGPVPPQNLLSPELARSLW